MFLWAVLIIANNIQLGLDRISLFLIETSIKQCLTQIQHKSCSLLVGEQNLKKKLKSPSLAKILVIFLNLFI